MTRPIFRLLQALAKWLLAVAWLVITIGATGLLFFGNFLVAWQAFALMNFEPEPLATIALLGPIASALGVGDAQIAATYAAVMTVAMAVTVISACKFGNDAVTLFFDMRQARLANAYDRAAGIKLCEIAIAFAVSLALAFLLVRADVSLFGLRLEALLSGADHIEEATKWAPEGVARLGDYLAVFAARFQEGYIALIIGVAYTTEKAFQRASERWLVFGQTIDAFVGGESSVLADRAEPLVVTGDDSANLLNPLPPASRRDDDRPPGPSDASRGATTSVRPVPVGPPPPATAPPGDDSAHGNVRGPVVSVIAGPGERRDVHLQEIERHPDEYVRNGSGRAWFSRAYYEQVMQAPRPTEPQEETAHE